MPEKSKKIVIIEDDKILLKALNVELLGEGFDVVSAIDGESGLKLVKKETPDLVILDLILPKMNGFDVLAALKKDDATMNIPIVILTNLGEDENRRKGMKMGAMDYFVKSSVGIEDITTKINRIFG